MHKQLFFTDDEVPDEHNCCKRLFNTDPYFTAQGTCYITKEHAFERYPFTWSTIEVWLHFDATKSPGEVNSKLFVTRRFFWPTATYPTCDFIMYS